MNVDLNSTHRFKDILIKEEIQRFAAKHGICEHCHSNVEMFYLFEDINLNRHSLKRPNPRLSVVSYLSVNKRRV